MLVDINKIDEGKIYSWDEVQKLGFARKKFVKKTVQGHVALMNRVVFHDKVYFEGITFEIVKNTKKFRAEKNDLGFHQVNRLSNIQRIESEIEEVESSIWAWRFDSAVPEKVAFLEGKLRLLKDELLEQVKDTVGH